MFLKCSTTVPGRWRSRISGSEERLKAQAQRPNWPLCLFRGTRAGQSKLVLTNRPASPAEPPGFFRGQPGLLNALRVTLPLPADRSGALGAGCHALFSYASDKAHIPVCSFQRSPIRKGQRAKGQKLKPPYTPKAIVGFAVRREVGEAAIGAPHVVGEVAPIAAAQNTEGPGCRSCWISSSWLT